MAQQAIVAGPRPLYGNQTGTRDGTTIAGYLDETVQVAVTITPSVGAATATGQAPTVTKSASAYASPSVGAATITGVAPTVTKTVNAYASPSVGAATITGQAPTVTTTNVAVQDGIAVGPGINCYEGLTFWRAGMGTGGIDAILYTGPS